MTQNIEQRTLAATNTMETAAKSVDEIAHKDADVVTPVGTRKSFPKISREWDEKATELKTIWENDSANLRQDWQNERNELSTKALGVKPWESGVSETNINQQRRWDDGHTYLPKAVPAVMDVGGPNDNWIPFTADKSSVLSDVFGTKPLDLVLGMTLTPNTRNQYPKLLSLGNVWELNDGSNSFVVSDFLVDSDGSLQITSDKGDIYQAERLYGASRAWTEFYVGEISGRKWIPGGVAEPYRDYVYLVKGKYPQKFYSESFEVMGVSPIGDPNFKPRKENISELNAYEYFGLSPNSEEDQSIALYNALLECDRMGVFLSIDYGKIYANIEVSGINLRIKGDGEIIPFNKNFPAFVGVGGFENTKSVLNIETVTDVVVPTHGVSVLSRLTVPGHNFKVDDIVKVVSEDLIPSVLASDYTRNGEWASIYSVDGDFVYLNIILKNKYITSPRIAKLRDITADISLNFNGIDASLPSKHLFQLIGFKKPKVKCKLKNNGGAGVILTSNYNPIIEYEVENLKDDVANNMYGYGLVDVGNAFLVALHPRGRSCRHVYTTGKSGVSNEIFDYGESFKSFIHNGVAENCTSTAWDTHSQGDGIRFSVCLAVGCRASFLSRCKDVEWDHCHYEDTYIGFRALNVTSNNFVSATLNKCSGKGADIPLSAISQGGGRSKMIVNGGDFGFRLLLTTPLPFSSANVILRGDATLWCESAESKAVLMQSVDSYFLVESAKISLENTDMGLFGVFQLVGDSHFEVTEELEVPINKASGELFFSSDVENTSKISVDKIITNGFNKDRQVNGINGEVVLTLVDTEDMSRSSGYKYSSINESDPIVFHPSNDENLYLKLITSINGSSPTSIPDGTFPGQQACFHVDSGGDLLIDSSLPNVVVGASISPKSAKIATWQPAGWVFS
ncbi:MULTISPECIES: hypothetical protein [unclassified Vibrio]|nr:MULTISPECIES: hypothetical protein [unclassified Vibrio]MBO0243279.1 hypothetical protein [Vibrio sp. Vb0592]MDW1864559.1 hypothetical protein [Vibrio sp. Vb1127]MDW1909501.1 hypothetical protein [Vibrio sp. 707]MDW1920991.1 hypothetical protein [Vibrio sp. 736]MDW2043245.1 hypothetical protein [Vibrio sp. 708]